MSIRGYDLDEKFHKLTINPKKKNALIEEVSKKETEE